MRSLLLATAATLALAAPAAAVTIELGTSLARYTVSGGSPVQGGEIAPGADAFSISNNDTPFYTLTYSFDLPTGFTNGALSISNLLSDDRAVVQLNGTSLLGAGIFGPGAGRFLFTEAGPAQDFTFAGNGAQAFLTNAGLVTGQNTLTIIVNNTNNGIFGDTLTGGPSQIQLDGAVTFDVEQVPAPAALALFGLGVAALGLARRR